MRPQAGFYLLDEVPALGPYAYFSMIRQVGSIQNFLQKIRSWISRAAASSPERVWSVTIAALQCSRRIRWIGVE